MWEWEEDNTSRGAGACVNINRIENYTNTESNTHPCPIFSYRVYFFFGSPMLTIVPESRQRSLRSQQRICPLSSLSSSPISPPNTHTKKSSSPWRTQFLHDFLICHLSFSFLLFIWRFGGVWRRKRVDHGGTSENLHDHHHSMVRIGFPAKSVQLKWAITTLITHLSKIEPKQLTKKQTKKSHLPFWVGAKMANNLYSN